MDTEEERKISYNTKVKWCKRSSGKVLFNNYMLTYKFIHSFKKMLDPDIEALQQMADDKTLNHYIGLYS